jgi:type VI protein secretion system component Hcp
MANATLLMKLQGPLGPIDGESTVEGYERMIVLEGWSWTLAIKDDKPVPTGISFSKLSDRATIPMLKLLQACEDAPSAEVLIEEDSVDSKLELKLTLTNVRFVSFALTGRVDDKSGSMEERWTMRPDNMRIDYRSFSGKQGIRFDVDFDPGADSRSPEQLNEDQIVSLAAKLAENRLEPLFKRIKDTVTLAQRKETRSPPGTREEGPQ